MVLSRPVGVGDLVTGHVEQWPEELDVVGGGLYGGPGECDRLDSQLFKQLLGGQTPDAVFLEQRGEGGLAHSSSFVGGGRQLPQGKAKGADTSFWTTSRNCG